MKRVASLFVLSLIVSGCKTTPGIEEPKITECILDVPYSDCDGTLIATAALIGYIAVSPPDRAKIANHHDALHTELNQCPPSK